MSDDLPIEESPAQEQQQNPIDFIEKKFKEYDELNLKFKAYHKAAAEEIKRLKSDFKLLLEEE